MSENNEEKPAKTKNTVEKPAEIIDTCKPNKISKKGNQGNALSAQTRAVLYNVLQYAFREKKAKRFLLDINKAMDRVAAMTGICAHTLSTIKKEGTSNGGVWENKVWVKRKKIITNPTDVDKMNIINKIEEFRKRNEHITLIKLHKELKQENKFAGGRSSLQIVLRLMGYKWEKSETHKKVLQKAPIPPDNNTEKSKKVPKKKVFKKNQTKTLQEAFINNFSPICNIEEGSLKHNTHVQKFMEYQQPSPMQEPSHLQGPSQPVPSHSQMSVGPYNIQTFGLHAPDYIFNHM